jgi:hypothetical protein
MFKSFMTVIVAAVLAGALLVAPADADGRRGNANNNGRGNANNNGRRGNDDVIILVDRNRGHNHNHNHGGAVVVNGRVLNNGHHHNHGGAVVVNGRVFANNHGHNHIHGVNGFNVVRFNTFGTRTVVDGFGNVFEVDIHGNARRVGHRGGFNQFGGFHSQGGAVIIKSGFGY